MRNPTTLLLSLGAAFAAFAPASARADELELVDGRTVKGAVLKESEDKLWVDLGFTVIEVPKGKIVTRRESDAVEPVVEATEQRKDLWTEAKLRPIEVQEAIERFGEGVVMVKTPSGLGSGFITREDGYLITNAHVIQGEIDVSVTVYTRKEGRLEKKAYEDIEIIAVNPFVDLALLRIDSKELGDAKLTKVYFGRIEELKQGEKVFAVGAPLGLDFSVTQGSVSSVNRENEGKVYVQIDAPINPGNSGGPLFNDRGEVIGVNSWKIRSSEGLNFAIPIDYVKHFVVNRDAFAFDRDNPNSGHRYMPPPRKGKTEEAAGSDSL
jgi:serine protease Do